MDRIIPSSLGEVEGPLAYTVEQAADGSYSYEHRQADVGAVARCLGGSPSPDTPQAVQPPEVPPAGVAAPGGGILRELGLCEWDGCRALTRRQKRFASAKCCGLWHDSLHPRINPPSEVGAQECVGCVLGWEIVDGKHRADVYSEARGGTDNIPCTRAGSIKARIAALLSSDGRNRTGDQIAYELRISGATALRELRKLRHDGARISMQRLHGPSRPAVYFMSREA